MDWRKTLLESSQSGQFLHAQINNQECPGSTSPSVAFSLLPTSGFGLLTRFLSLKADYGSFYIRLILLLYCLALFLSAYQHFK